MRRVLMLAYYFPPLGGIGSLRAVKFATYLPEFGWEPTVVAPRDGAYHRDPSLTFPEQRVMRTASLEVSRIAKRATGVGGTDTSPAVVGSRLAIVRDLARRWIYHPDAQVGWYPFALAAARRALRERRFDTILSSSFPITGHLVARRLHRDTGLPWIAEFRDPWADVIPGAREGDRSDRLERALVREASAVVTVSPEWADRFRDKGARHVEVVTNGFDPVDLPAPSPITDFVVTHLGSFYPRLQDLRAVWEALARMRAQEPALRVRLRFVGDTGSELLEQIAAYGLTDALEVTGFLPHRAALAATATSSMLIAAGFRVQHALYRGVIPAKLFEYLGSGVPILYASDTDTDATRLLAGQRECYVIRPEDVNGAFQALQASRRGAHVERIVAGFTRRALTGSLARLLDGVADGGQGEAAIVS
jgi:glycosyltransferase involved in cell wall biosynthesis